MIGKNFENNTYPRTKTAMAPINNDHSVSEGMYIPVSNPRMGLETGMYIPSLTEWSLFIGAIAVFVLGYVLFSKFFPIISIWEIEEGRKESVEEVEKRVKSYLPGPANVTE